MINEIFKSVNKSKFAANGDRVDKVANYHSVIIYIIAAIFLSLSPFVSGPFLCTQPAQWKPNWMTYAQQYCYLMNSYYVPFEQDSIQQQIETGEAFEVTYYQWIPYYLVLSSIIFMLPYMYWTSITKLAGIDLEFLITKASDFDATMSPEKREEKMAHLASFIDVYLDNQEQVPGKKSFFEKIVDNFKCCSNEKGTLMGNNYLFCKFLYIAVICFQLFSIDRFLGRSLILYAFRLDVISESLLQSSFKWREQELFPLVTFCNFTKQIANGNSESTFVQCTMPNNIYNERVFIILCYWLVLLLALTILSTISWFNAIFLSFGREKMVRHLIAVSNREKSINLDKSRLSDFVNWYLHSDGIFVFRMMSKNASKVVASEVMNKLWDHFNDNYDEERKHRRQKSKRSKMADSKKGEDMI